MDFTALMIETGMTMKDLKKIPKITLHKIINTLEERLETAFIPKDERDRIYYRIDCYTELLNKV